MNEYVNMSPDDATEAFLRDMRTKTGVSWRFLNSARPLVRRAFIEVPPERRSECLSSLQRAFARQAEIESLAQEAKAALDGARVQLLATHNLFGQRKNQKNMPN